MDLEVQLGIIGTIPDRQVECLGHTFPAHPLTQLHGLVLGRELVEPRELANPFLCILLNGQTRNLQPLF